VRAFTLSSVSGCQRRQSSHRPGAHGAHSNRPCLNWRYVSPEAAGRPRCGQIDPEQKIANANACAKRSLARSRPTSHSSNSRTRGRTAIRARDLTYCALVRDVLSVM
jgi:hypothetical protein